MERSGRRGELWVDCEEGKRGKREADSKRNSGGVREEYWWEEDEELEKWRRRNVIWRRIEGRSEEERKETIVEKVLGKEGKIIRVRERSGEEGGRMLIVEFEEERVAREIMKNRGEIRYYWGVRVDEDLTMRERRNRWRMVEKARREREKGKRVRMTNRRMWSEEVEWRWVEESEEWVRVEE